MGAVLRAASLPPVEVRLPVVLAGVAMDAADPIDWIRDLSTRPLSAVTNLVSRTG